ncbi:alpha/beta hydrolase [Calidifontibacter terrae]
MKTYQVPVQGGDLVVHDLSAPEVDATAPTVVLVHGITANALTWSAVAEQLRSRLGEKVRLIAPDLRGRAGSREVTDPAGLRAHADDVSAVASAFAYGGPPLLVGHSMGAFVAALAGALHPDRFRAVVLVDGGIYLPLPDGLTPDQAIDAVVGPAMARLSMTFADEAAYLDFWADHPAVGPLLAGDHAAAVRDYLLYDLIPAPGGGLRSSCQEAVVRADGRDIMVDSAIGESVSVLAAHEVPMTLVWAARDLMARTPGLYGKARLDALGLPASLRQISVDTDHYAMVFEPEPVQVIVDAIVAHLAMS